MDKNVKRIKEYADKILNCSENKTFRSIDELKEKTDLKEDKVHLGLGWLAKNEEIQGVLKNERNEGNKSIMNQDVEENAEKIKHVLMNQSKKNVATLSKISELPSNEVYAAIGFLAREGKIKIFDDRTLQQKFSLKE